MKSRYMINIKGERTILKIVKWKYLNLFCARRQSSEVTWFNRMSVDTQWQCIDSHPGRNSQQTAPSPCGQGPTTPFYTNPHQTMCGRSNRNGGQGLNALLYCVNLMDRYVINLRTKSYNFQYQHPKLRKYMYLCQNIQFFILFC